MVDLQSLNNIFKERILRIPDYQRGYAWTKAQLEDYWDDLVQLDSSKVHYTGVITLEPVTEKVWSKWSNDEWLIEDLDYQPFYVVDGQQRLTTSIILIQAIIESVKGDDLVASQSIDSILKKFILSKADDGFRESYIFGYEKDNPSDEFLRTQIFGQYSHSNHQQETLYTRNLRNAKDFFKEQLSLLNLEEITNIYKKLTQKFKFNLYIINDEIDVFVTFETMNNRGKPLSSLELLKNRLIYLSTLYKENTGRDKLRTNINEAWKTMYEYLGKNAEAPLNDDVFLRNHWIMYFKYSRNKGDDYIKFLLNDKFNTRNILHPENMDSALRIEEISEYVKSLQQSIISWFYMHNPYFDQSSNLTDDQRKWLANLARVKFRSFRPLILATLVSNQDSCKIVALLKAIERYNFILFNISQRKANTGDSTFYVAARELLSKSTTIDAIIAGLEVWINRYYDPKKFLEYIEDRYKLHKQEGFYNWDGVRYFLYEYEQWLRDKGKQSTNKISWDTFKLDNNDNVTLEHIYPQTDTDPYWQGYFGHLNAQQKLYFVHSLGNLLPLSRAKNSSLQNDSFDLKKNNNEGVGYYNGSASENEVNLEPIWTPEEIKNRGMKLLAFMEERWAITLGDQLFKEKLLHVVDTTAM